MEAVWSWWPVPDSDQRVLAAWLPRLPSRAEQIQLSEALSLKLFGLHGLQLTGADIGRTIYGKPQLRGSSLHHSLANTGQLTIGIGAVVPVGIDVEAQHRLFRVNPDLLRRRMFITKQDANLWEQNRTLLQVWTAKEAVLKASGFGLAGGMSNVTLSAADNSCGLHGEQYRLTEWSRHGFHVALAERLRT